MNFPEDYQIVMSTGNPSNPISLVKYRRNMIVYNWIPNRFEYLKASDLVVSRAGHGTLTQSIYYGKPMILIPTPSHTEQMNNAQRVEEMGIAKVIEQNVLSSENLLRAVNTILLNDSYRRKLGEIQEKIIKINGLETIVNIILKVAEGKFIHKLK